MYKSWSTKVRTATHAQLIQLLIDYLCWRCELYCVFFVFSSSLLRHFTALCVCQCLSVRLLPLWRIKTYMYIIAGDIIQCVGW